MTIAASNSAAPAPIPEFDVAVLGRSFASRRSVIRLRDELHLSVLDVPGGRSGIRARYDEIDHRWEITAGTGVVARAKFVVDGDGRLPVRGRDDAVLSGPAVTSHGFPNFFRATDASPGDAVGYSIACIEYMRTHRHDYVERRVRIPIADDDYPELSFDRPTPRMWVG